MQMMVIMPGRRHSVPTLECCHRGLHADYGQLSEGGAPKGWGGLMLHKGVQGDCPRQECKLSRHHRLFSLPLYSYKMLSLTELVIHRESGSSRHLRVKASASICFSHINKSEYYIELSCL